MTTVVIILVAALAVLFIVAAQKPDIFRIEKKAVISAPLGSMVALRAQRPEHAEDL